MRIEDRLAVSGMPEKFEGGAGDGCPAKKMRQVKGLHPMDNRVRPFLLGELPELP